MNLERYSRQILYPGIGKEGQQKLELSHVVVIGCGALGSLHAEMLSRAGVGRLRLIDRDFIEESNLQRQIMFEERHVAERLPKAVAAAERIQRINSAVAVEPVVKDVNYSNIEGLIRDADLVIDGTDNFEVRYLINDAAVKLNIPWVYGAVVGAYGVQMTILPRVTPCLRCVFPEMPAPGTSPTCDTAGVILPAIAVISAYQVTEAMKILTGKTSQLHGSLIQIDMWENRFSRLRIDGLRAQSDCRTCVQGSYDALDASGGQLVTTLCGRNAVQITPAPGAQIDFADLASQLHGLGEVSYNRYLLKFRIGDQEITVFPDARSIIKGTDDPNLARSLYARFIGA
ncbi:MAG: ThiF family adenylyltransferase [Acidobacteria bacterium]|nr:ThiF family adenylyltransferase [Acidobacteriota bacterium]